MGDEIDYKNLEENKERGSLTFPIGIYVMEYVSPGSVLHYHWHYEWQWTCQIKGNSNLIIDGKSYHLEEGESVFINKGQTHSGMTDIKNGTCTMMTLVFFPEKVYESPWAVNRLIDQFFNGAYSMQTFYGRNSPGELIVNNCLREIYESLSLPTMCKNIIIHAQLHLLLGYILKYQLYGMGQGNISSSEESDTTKSILNYLYSHYAEKITLEAVAKHANSSIPSICRIFKKEIGATIIDYLNTYRIYKATALLMKTQYSINEISEKCGFVSTSYFIKAFKNRRGITPAQYRFNIQKGQDVHDEMLFLTGFSDNNV